MSRLASGRDLRKRSMPTSPSGRSGRCRNHFAPFQGGVFLFKRSGLRFAQENSAPIGGATMFLAEGFELDVENRGNPLVAWLDSALGIVNRFIPAYRACHTDRAEKRQRTMAMTHTEQAEPPSWFRPPVFVVGQDRRGYWVVQDQQGIRGGLFVNRDAALRFVRSENGYRPQGRRDGFW